MLPQKLIQSLLCLTVLSSCVELAVINAVNPGESKSGKTTSRKNVENIKRSPYNSMYSKRDIAGCLGAALISPVVIITEGLFNSLLGNDEVSLYFNEKTIALVKRDVDLYLETNTRISPEDFWQVLSSESINELTYAFIENGYSSSITSLKRKKQQLAHAFLYLFESGVEKGTYTFSYDSRDKGVSSGRTSIAFASSKRRIDSTDVGVCGYFRSNNFDVEVDHGSGNPDSTLEVKCTDGKDRVDLSVDYRDTYKIKVNGKETLIDYADFDVEEDESLKSLEFDNWFKYPKINLATSMKYSVDKGERVYAERDISQLSLSIEYDKKTKLKFNKMKCLTVTSNK
jgi:hypothetical protein